MNSEKSKRALFLFVGIVYTSIPTVFISDQYLSTRPKWSIFRKCSNSQRRTTRPCWPKSNPSRPRNFKQRKLVSECVSEWVGIKDLHWAKEQEAWKLVGFPPQQSSKTEIFVFSHQRSHNRNSAGSRLGVDPATGESYRAQKEGKLGRCGAKPKPLQWLSMVEKEKEKEKSWVQFRTREQRALREGLN